MHILLHINVQASWKEKVVFSERKGCILEREGCILEREGCILERKDYLILKEVLEFQSPDESKLASTE